jgi:hypothetical protein
MRIELDVPLDFDRVRCEICQQEDEDWHVMHFLADGMWRKLKKGASLREQGIDELDTSRLYCIHACTEPILRTFVTLNEIQVFLKSLRERN